MLLSVYQTLLFCRRHDIEQEYARQAKACVSPSPAKRMSAFATCFSKGLEKYWYVPANDRHTTIWSDR